MAYAQSMEGTWDELVLHADEFRGKKLRLTVVADETSATQETSSPQNLAEFLGDFIGCIEGSGGNNSEDTGKKFADHLAKKHQENHL